MDEKQSYKVSGEHIRKIMENEPERLANAERAREFLNKQRSKPEDSEGFLGAKMYEPSIEAIYAGLGIPPCLGTSEFSRRHPK